MASFLDNNGLQKLGLLMSGIASTTSRDPRYLQTNLAMQDSFQEMKDRERMEAEREKQDLLLRRLANPTSQDMIGTPATKAFEVNGRMVGQNAPAQMQQVMPDEMRLRSLQRAMPKQFMAAELEQLLAGPAKPTAVAEGAALVGADGREIYRNAGAKEPKLETIFDAQGREIKVFIQPDGSYKPIGGAKAMDAGARQQPPTGYRFTPDGNLAAIPGGPADKPNDASPAPAGYRKTADGRSLEPIPGGPADIGQKGLPQAYKDQKAAFENMEGTIKEYDSLLKQTGTEYWNSTKAQRLKSLQTQMMLGMKDIAKTGTLDASTMTVMETLIPDATSFGANMNMLSGSARAKANLDELSGYVSRARAATDRAYGAGDKPPPSGGESPQGRQ